jgi:hypothetical protein
MLSCVAGRGLVNSPTRYCIVEVEIGDAPVVPVITFTLILRV